MKLKKLTIPREIGQFYLVPEELMTQYDKFQSEVSSVAQGYKNFLIIPSKIVIFEGMHLMSYCHEHIDNLCQWIQSNPSIGLDGSIQSKQQ